MGPTIPWVKRINGTRNSFAKTHPHFYSCFFFWCLMSVQAREWELLQERQFLGPGPVVLTTTKPKSIDNLKTSRTSSTSFAEYYSTSTTWTTSSSSTSSSTTSSSPTSTSTNSSPPVTVFGKTVTVTIASSGGQTSAVVGWSNPAPEKGFLVNRVMSGTALDLVGLVSLIFLIVIASCVIKRRRKKKLLEEALPVRFHPVMGTDTTRKQRPRNYQTDPPPYHLGPPFN
ncbi:hypothetical protein BYT27DRAFT_7188834 [Phlegmacium glaucopus]|nr:hypothetical protein BYT27DRAFT_7188834 [Phlegmacium glaucopus]